MAVFNNLGTLRDFVENFKIPAKLIKPEKLPKFLDKIFVVGYELERSNGTRLSFTIAYKDEYKINIPGVDDFYFVVAGGDVEGYTFLSFHISVKPNVFVEFRDINFDLRFEENLLKPVDPKDDFSRVRGSAQVKVTKDLDFTFNLFESLSLNKSYIGDTEFIIEATDVMPDFSKKSSPEEIIKAGFSKEFIGVYFGEVKLTFPEDFKDIVPADVSISKTMFGSEGFAGIVKGNWTPSYDHPNKKFTGNGSGDLLGLPFGLNDVSVIFEKNSFAEANLKGYLLLSLIHI